MGVPGASETGAHGTEPGGRPAPATSRQADRREQARMVVAVLIGAFIAAFAVLNLDRVKVDWIVTTTHTPLIVVIVVSFLLGMAGDRLLLYRARRRRQGKS